MTEPFHIQDVPVGDGSLFFLLGPCALESEDFAWEMARAIRDICGRLGVPFLFKASYDKANRTSVSSFRGPGVREGCQILAAIGKDLGVPVTTDIHDVVQVEIPGSCDEGQENCKLSRLTKELCSTFDLVVEQGKTRVNLFWEVGGSLDLECEFEEGSVEAHVRFQKCS